MQKKQTNSYAFSSLILSLFFWVPLINIFTSSLAVVFGFVALKELKSNKEQKGKAFAIAAITIGIVTLMLSFIGIILYYFFPELLE
ncbi:MAG: DUF4190 domain-containing protein [Nanoarchaeota archaeon]|nr:DUF4190 domain-containing protein [Nanoarchaeota archaeon]